MNTRDMLKMNYPDAPDDALDAMAKMRDAGQEGFTALAHVCESAASDGEWSAVVIVRNKKHGIISYASVGGATGMELQEMFSRVLDVHSEINAELASNTIH